MQKLIGMMLLLTGSAVMALAQVQTPEIDPASATSGLVLLGGILLVVRARSHK